MFCFYMSLSCLCTSRVFHVVLLAGHRSFLAVWCCWGVDPSEPFRLQGIPRGQGKMYAPGVFKSTHWHESQAITTLYTDTTFFQTYVNIRVKFENEVHLTLTRKEFLR